MRRPTHRGKRPQHASLVMVGLSLDGKSPPLVDFQLTEREYSTIGFVTVHWAYLEYALLDRTLNLARKARLKPPAEALSSRFKDRVDALKKIGERALKRNPELEKLRDLLKRVEGAYSQGLKLTHGHLTYNAQKPDLLWATLFLKPGARSESLSIKKLVDFARTVGELSFELMYPGGEKQYAAERARSGNFVSRRFLMAVMGKTATR